MPTHPYLDLPDPTEFRRRCRQRAVLDLICSRGDTGSDTARDGLTYRAQWRPATGLATWRDSMGHEWSAVFSAEGTYLRGFDRDSPMNPLHWQRNRLWDGLLDDLPAHLVQYVRDPDVDSTFRFYDGDDEIPAITLCAWQLPSDRTWQCSNYEPPEREDEDIEGLEYLFRDVVDWTPDELAESIGDYWGTRFDPAAICAILTDTRLTPELISAINTDADPDWVRAKAEPTGYPM